MNVYDIGLGVEMVIPYTFEQHGAGYDFSCMAHEKFQQAEFAGLEVDFLARAVHGARKQVYGQITHVKMGGGLGYGAVAACQRFKPGQKLGERKRLGHVIVSTRLQARHLVFDIGQGGKQQNGRSVAHFAQSGEDMQALGCIRQHPVEDDDIKDRSTRME